MPQLRLPDPPLGDGDIVLRLAPLGRPRARGGVPGSRDPALDRRAVAVHRASRATSSPAAGRIATPAGSWRSPSSISGAPCSGDRPRAFRLDDGKAEIGYWIAREARRRAVGARATRLLARWALTDLGLERLELLANPENEASQRLAKRAGFTREGVLRSYRRRHGRREDLVMFSLLAEDLE